MAQLRVTNVKSIAAALLLTIHIALSAKPNPRPVFESINEQSRIDDSVRLSSSPGILPYGNPLAGNSKQNARIHANNQQAMFNAERMRQHKAQLQRWSKGPRMVDSYMQAYHDSQENHQLAWEKQQATSKDIPVTMAPVTRSQGRPARQRIVQRKRISPNTDSPPRNAQETSSPANRVQKQRLEPPRRGETRFLQVSEPTKITKADAVIKDTRNRNHRSYGSADYHQNLEPKRYKTVYVSPTPSYEQGVTIKPNGNAGITQTNEPTNLYTASIPSHAKQTYPNIVNSLQPLQDIQVLNSLLNKNPTDQLSEFNALLNNDKTPDDITKGVPVDFYFYLRDPTQQPLTQNYDNIKYSQLPQKYASAFEPETNPKDHKPITEEVDDIEDPNKGPVMFNLQPVPPTIVPDQTTTTKSNNYYKVEVASQTISTGPKHIKGEYYVKQENDPHYESLTYGYQPIYKETDDSKSEMYLHHNAEPTGVQHLLEDGTETSAFGDDNLQYAANYDFGYRVRDQESGNYYGHREAKQGKSTKGSYHVLLPDGRMQLVKYSAGPSGFHADITYDHLQ
ncbi:uncharacterized protein LOC120634722 [Pararge aegeria]|uniref:uncharacterized protein LOC120634722 n=1 Tax=Pararge aegeria TaxID=116150 RepID=UPI0019D11186|nr:uncharacterized protein LOC120634722 [Pararge aegeria]